MVNNGLNYHTVYSWSLNGSVEKIKDWVCFSELYRGTRKINGGPTNSGKISIKVYFDPKFNAINKDNYCLLNDRELKEYFDWINKITKFNLRISKTIQLNDGMSRYESRVITTKFSKKTPYKIRLICALIRNLYENPYNIMIKSAFLMKSMEDFSKLDFTERLCISINSIYGYNTGHSIFESSGVEFYNNKSLRKRYLLAAKVENNVNGFMPKNIQVEFDRIYYGDTESEDSDDSIFSPLEKDIMPNKLRNKLIKNYELIKNNE